MYSWLSAIIIILGIFIFLEILVHIHTKDVITIHEPIIKNNTKSKIPRVIYRTWYSKTLNSYMYKVAYESWIKLNPDYTMIWNDHDARDEYMKNFGQREYKAYRKLIPGAYKADLWRACILYEKGGIYVDSYAVPLVSIDEMIVRSELNDEDNIFIASVDGSSGIHNGFIIATPKHPFLKQYIKDMVINIEQEKNDNILAITGPVCLEQSIQHVLNITPIKYYLFTHVWGFYQFITDNDKNLLCKKYDILYCYIYLKLLISDHRNYLYSYSNNKIYN